ncbi:MAG: membrane protein insertion efficiency factor YidD [Planctomycetes bacterium]|nr:membrane protein insertion efficiency factor YidD [Planctomycetota bacterium]
MKWALLKLIRGYQVLLSPLLGRDKCRFTPSCSKYAQEAIETHGSLKGAGMGLWRILRCQPLAKGGYDPVPLKKHESK